MLNLGILRKIKIFRMNDSKTSLKGTKGTKRTVVLPKKSTPLTNGNSLIDLVVKVNDKMHVLGSTNRMLRGVDDQEASACSTWQFSNGKGIGGTLICLSGRFGHTWHS